ncbi:MAG: zinc ribbon domain-containing protein [Candidatus Hermodarchaeota archaeon]
MKKALNLLLFLLIGNLISSYLLLNLIPVPFYDTYCYHDEDYSLIINEGDKLEIQWQYKTINQTLINDLTNQTNLSLEENCYNQDDIFVWIVSMTETDEEDIDEEDLNYWEVIIDEYYSIKNDANYMSSHKYRIAKSPSNYMKNMVKNDNYYTNRLIPIETKYFLNSVKIYYQGSNALYSNNSIIYKITSNSLIKQIPNNTDYIEIISYNDKGIMTSDTIRYKNCTVMALEILNYDIDRCEPSVPHRDRYTLIYRLLTLNLLLTFISIIVIIIALIISYNENEKSSLKQGNSHISDHYQPKKVNNRINGNKNQVSDSRIEIMSPTINQVCSNCSTVSDKNARFCTNCGLKLNNQIQYCQYCGRIKQKNANFCIECGFKF